MHVAHVARAHHVSYDIVHYVAHHVASLIMTGHDSAAVPPAALACDAHRSSCRGDVAAARFPETRMAPPWDHGTMAQKGPKKITKNIN